MPVAPDRPRHIPRHSAVPASVARARSTRSAADDEVKAPGLLAMARRSPRLPRQLAAGAIGAGVVLFVVAGVASAATGTQPKPATAAKGSVAATSSPLAIAPAPVTTSAAPAPVTAKVVAAAPVRSKVKAPSSKAVISGLAANGIPNVALNAYRVAAARMASALPSCGIDWAMLAGIGREESDHGRFAGAVLNADGTSSPRIIGPALNGAGSDYIPAPADGLALDGDAKYTHALGPMQFIPQTWASYGVDANGDGKADIFNINDAALSAARYLCAAGGDLRTQTGRVKAVLAYNHNDEYLAQVLALAQAYRTGVTVTGVPVGELTGALPPITAGSSLGVNPGLPTAVGAKRSGKQPAKKSGSTASKHPGQAAGSPASPPKAGGSSSAPKSGSGSASPGSSGGSGSGGGSGGSPGSGPGTSPTPTPTPTPSCKFGIGGACLVP